MAMTFRPDQGKLGDNTSEVHHKYILDGDRVHQIHNIVVHRFSLSDVEDPELYAAQPIWEWQQTETGKWVMEHAVEAPVWRRHVDYSRYPSCHYSRGTSVTSCVWRLDNELSRICRSESYI